MKLNLKAFALTSGLTLGVGIFLFTWWVIALRGITGELTIFGMLYPGYSISPSGSFIGLGYGFVDGIIFGGMFAWFYNKLLKPSPQN